MPKLQVFDPPMCCSTGVCGPEVDPALVHFASDLEWLRKKGVHVERVNLSQQPAAFLGNAVVAEAMRGGDGALPLLLVDGKIVARGRYPAREALAALVGIEVPTTIYSEVVQELVAIGAAIASNCEPCFRFHYDKARKLGISREDMARAVATAKMVKEAPARAVLALADKYLEGKVDGEETPQASCTPGNGAPVSLSSPSAKKCC